MPAHGSEKGRFDKAYFSLEHPFEVAKAYSNEFLIRLQSKSDTLDAGSACALCLLSASAVGWAKSAF